MQKSRMGAPIPLITILLLGALVLSLLGACGGGSDDEDTPAKTTTPVQTTEPVETTPAPAETPEPVATEAPVEEPEPTIGKLFLEVTSPEDETVITTEQITVTGETLPTAIVSVNGTLTKVEANGTFSYPMTLEIGPNDIQVVASTIGGDDETGKVLVVVYIPE